MKATKDDFQGKPDTSKLTSWSEAEIQSLLANLPKTIYYYGEEAQKAQKAYLEAKSVSKQKNSEYQLKALVLKEKYSSATDRKAWASTREEVIEAESAEIQAGIEKELAELKHEYYENLFTAVRKAANLVEKDTTAVQNYGKYKMN